MARYFILTMVILIIHQPPLDAAQNEKKSIEKMTIAVSNFEANECKPSLARAVSDMLAGKIYSMDFFILLERNQMDLIMREKGIHGEKFINAEEAAKLGKILSVQKMVVGSVSKLGNYRIEVRVINVGDSSVDISLSERAGNEKDFEKAVDVIVDKIERFYLGLPLLTGKFDLSLTGTVLQGIGNFTKGTGLGYGFNLNFFWNKPFGWIMPVIFSSGFYSFTPKIKSIKSFYMAPVEIGTGYPIFLAKNIRLLPVFGLGYMLSFVSYDKFERTITPSSYKSDFYYNPFLSIQAGLNIFLFNRWLLAIVPKYTVIFETKRIGHIVGINLGFKVMF